MRRLLEDHRAAVEVAARLLVDRPRRPDHLAVAPLERRHVRANARVALATALGRGQARDADVDPPALREDRAVDAPAVGKLRFQTSSPVSAFIANTQPSVVATNTQPRETIGVPVMSPSPPASVVEKLHAGDSSGASAGRDDLLAGLEAALADVVAVAGPVAAADVLGRAPCLVARLSARLRGAGLRGHGECQEQHANDNPRGVSRRPLRFDAGSSSPHGGCGRRARGARRAAPTPSGRRAPRADRPRREPG